MIVMIKTEQFDTQLQELAHFSRVLSHPARLMILKYLAKKKVCISGDITEEIPLSRTTVSQHLKELKKVGLIQGTVDGLKINYCLNPEAVKTLKARLDDFFREIDYNHCC
jgi:ArsR family transcriptional regulator, arsenate/arsenite/antimonite-responsive transcriptional repressor